jgi:iron complex transport system permease protein
MQGLFRNPLADPGLVGVSAGASLAAAVTIVLGDRYDALQWIGSFIPLPPVGAFLGGLAVTALLYAIATRGGVTSVAVLMLAGVALAALAGALNGLLIYMSDDRQLRDLTFWLLGSLGGSTWEKVVASAPLIVAALLTAPFLAHGLNALAPGEAEAFLLGVPVQRTKRAAILLVSIAVGASVAASGSIGFVGIVAPHALRLLFGADHRWIIPMSGALGALLLICADCLARSVAAPGELPIGILTAALGAPWFLFLLLQRKDSAWT